MAARRAYLDHNATSPLRPEAHRAMCEELARFGNPSSVHAEGRAARRCVERAREQVAALVAARREDVVFTSGGTEANAMALRPGALGRPDRSPVRLLMGASEHASVLQGHGFAPADCDLLPVDEDGRVDLAELTHRLDAVAGRGCLVSVQVANSETGVVQPIAEIASLVRGRGGLVHADAVQAAGRIGIDLGELGVDALTLSAHKLGGPMGIGALVLAPDRAGARLRLIGGGAQETRRRAGTENVPAIVGFGVAAEIAARQRTDEAVRLLDLRDRAEREIRRIAPDAVIFGTGERLPNTVAFAVPGLPADVALISFDLDGVAVSSGSACSSGKVARSHVLAAMGVPDELARGGLRLSMGWNSGPDDVTAFARAFEKLVRRLYERDRARAA